VELSPGVKISHCPSGAGFYAKLTALTNLPINTRTQQAELLRHPAYKPEGTQELAPGTVDKKAGNKQKSGKNPNYQGELHAEYLERVNPLNPVYSCKNYTKQKP
jgi:hypothetical protein